MRLRCISRSTQVNIATAWASSRKCYYKRMKLFRNYTFTWKQATLFKISLLAIGIAVGASWPALFAPYALLLAIVGIALGVYLAFALFK